MDRTKLVVLLMVTVVFCSLSFAQNGGLRFSLTDLQPSLGTGVTQSFANAINKNGMIAGAYSDSSGNQYCFTYYTYVIVGRRYTTVTKFTSSVTPYSCDVWGGIDSGGDVAGSMSVSGGVKNAFLHTYQNALTTFPSSFGTYNTFGYGIDDYKEVVGEMDAGPPCCPGPQTYATRWSANGTAVFLDNNYSAATATSSSGSLVAITDNGPWIWPYGPKLGNCCLNWPNSVNANNHSTGWTATSITYASHAALWLSDGSFTDLGISTTNSSGYSMSSDDWIVGWADTWDPAGNGFLRVSDRNCPVMVNLNTLLGSTGSGWSITAAYGINASHQIVGQGRNSAGQLHAVLLTPDNNLPLCFPD